MQLNTAMAAMAQNDPQPSIDVVFKRDEENEIKGKITRDMEKRTKIVFVYGYYPQRLFTWKGSLPQDGEEWCCEIVNDTLPDDPGRGALRIRLIENLTLLQNLKREKEEKRLQPIIQGPPELNLREAQEIESFANNFFRERGLKHSITILKEVAGIKALNFSELTAAKKQIIAQYHPDMDLIFSEATRIKVSFAILASRSIAWLKHLLENGIKAGKFQYVSKRDFRCCECGGLTRLSRIEFEKWENNELTQLICEHCGVKETATK
jgi:hypothetical protein